MIKATVVHDSKYGNTKLVAEAIAQGINQVPGVEIVVTKVDTVDLSQIDKFDVILIGSPNHIGGPTRAIKKFIDSLGKLKLEGKRGNLGGQYSHCLYSGTCFISPCNQTILSRYQLFPKYSPN